MKKAYIIQIHGRVQGVGFRYFTQRAAQEEGVKGWVRNQTDGSVHVFCQGTQAQIAGFEKKIRRGPALAAVTDFKMNAVPLQDYPGSFQIK